MWNSICIRYKKEGDKPGDVIDVCTDKEKTDFLAEIKKQKTDFSNWLCEKVQEAHRKKLIKAMACVKGDKNLQVISYEKEVAPEK